RLSKPFYSPGEIRFQRDEMIWLIEHLTELEDGKWPLDPSGAVAPEGRTGLKAEGHFVRPVQFAAEVKTRLSTTGEAGEALVDEIQVGILDYESLSRPAQRVLNYISGWRRRNQTYPEWRATGKYREGGQMPRFSGKQDLSQKQIQEKAKRKRNQRR
ncbi:hypothetical protein LCGC14_2360060, partial [marine sediment metagenome]